MSAQAIVEPRANVSEKSRTAASFVGVSGSEAAVLCSMEHRLTQEISLIYLNS